MDSRFITVDSPELVPRNVLISDALAAIRSHYRIAEDALRAAVESGRVLHVTDGFVHHHTCSSLGQSFHPERWYDVHELSTADEIKDSYLWVEKTSWCGPDQLRVISKLISPRDAEAMRGRRRCHICAPIVPDPQPRLPPVPKGVQARNLCWRDIGREYDGSRIAKIEITVAVRITCVDGRSFDFSIDDRVILGPPVNG